MRREGIFLINFVIILWKLLFQTAPQTPLGRERLPGEATLISGEANSSVSKREKTIIDRTIACYG